MHVVKRSNVLFWSFPNFIREMSPGRTTAGFCTTRGYWCGWVYPRWPATVENRRGITFVGGWEAAGWYLGLMDHIFLCLPSLTVLSCVRISLSKCSYQKSGTWKADLLLLNLSHFCSMLHIRTKYGHLWARQKWDCIYGTIQLFFIGLHCSNWVSSCSLTVWCSWPCLCSHTD